MRRRVFGLLARLLGIGGRLQERSNSFPSGSIHLRLATPVLRFRPRPLPIIWTSTIRILSVLHRICLLLKNCFIGTWEVPVDQGLQSSCGVLQPQCRTQTPDDIVIREACMGVDFYPDFWRTPHDCLPGCPRCPQVSKKIPCSPFPPIFREL